MVEVEAADDSASDAHADAAQPSNYKTKPHSDEPNIQYTLEKVESRIE